MSCSIKEIFEHPVYIFQNEEETFMFRGTCDDCGAEFEFSFAEMLRCSKDDDRPRPKCPKCGRSVEIGHARVLRDGEWVDEYGQANRS